ncbi:MAG: DNA repair protein RadC, partial [Chloroflexota bacterium]|nr:DNA repair protein RadC [Chloroflexota bacterium]
IHDLPSEERPRERLRDQGPGALSSHELLAILLRTGTRDEDVFTLSKRLLAMRRGLSGLAQTSFGELMQQHGLGPAKAAEVMAAMELGKRIASVPSDARTQVNSSADVVNLLLPEMMWLSRESLRVILLNTRNYVLGVREVYNGTVNSADVRVGEVFRDAVREDCKSVIVVHNHPSGDPTPSNEDVQVTGKLRDAGKLLDIELLDHVILARDGYVSLKERRQGFP